MSFCPSVTKFEELLYLQHNVCRNQHTTDQTFTFLFLSPNHGTNLLCTVNLQCNAWNHGHNWMEKRVWAYACTHARTHTQKQGHTHAHTHIAGAYTCTHTHSRGIHMHTHTDTMIHGHTHMHTSTQMGTHTHTHAHIHTLT